MCWGAKGAGPPIASHDPSLKWNNESSSLLLFQSTQTEISLHWPTHKLNRALGRLLLKFPWASVTKELRHLLILTETERFLHSDLSHISPLLCLSSPLLQGGSYALFLKWTSLISLRVFTLEMPTLAGVATAFLWWAQGRGISRVLAQDESSGLGKLSACPCWFQGRAKNTLTCDIISRLHLEPVGKSLLRFRADIQNTLESTSPGHWPE